MLRNKLIYMRIANSCVRPTCSYMSLQDNSIFIHSLFLFYFPIISIYPMLSFFPIFLIFLILILFPISPIFLNFPALDFTWPFRFRPHPPTLIELARACGVPAVGVWAVDCWQWRNGHYFHPSFPFFSLFFPPFSSVATFSHRRSARIKKRI